METYMTDEEQVERIKKWLNEYASTIIVSILIVVIGTFGWRYWAEKKDTIRMQASNAYMQLLSSTMDKNSDAFQVKAQSESIMKNYASTPYAKLAALILAKQEVELGDQARAMKELQWVMQTASTNSLKQIARNRLARIYIASGQANMALTQLQTVNDKAYLSAIDAIRGDAYVALGNTQLARMAYQSALTALSEKDESRAMLQMKLSDLPVD